MSLPQDNHVVRVRNVLMIAVPADPDDQTMSLLQQGVLEAMAANETKGVILDIALVESLDSFFARILGETAQMVSLMGGRTVVAGMRASVAITTTQLGLKLGGAHTALNVDRALDLLTSEPAETGADDES